jgi:hypothetical protein
MATPTAPCQLTSPACHVTQMRGDVFVSNSISASGQAVFLVTNRASDKHHPPTGRQTPGRYTQRGGDRQTERSCIEGETESQRLPWIVDDEAGGVSCVCVTVMVVCQEMVRVDVAEGSHALSITWVTPYGEHMPW